MEYFITSFAMKWYNYRRLLLFIRIELRKTIRLIIWRTLDRFQPGGTHTQAERGPCCLPSWKTQQLWETQSNCHVKTMWNRIDVISLGIPPALLLCSTSTLVVRVRSAKYMTLWVIIKDPGGVVRQMIRHIELIQTTYQVKSNHQKASRFFVHKLTLIG